MQSGSFINLNRVRQQKATADAQAAAQARLSTQPIAPDPSYLTHGTSPTGSTTHSLSPNPTSPLSPTGVSFATSPSSYYAPAANVRRHQSTGSRSLKYLAESLGEEEEEEEEEEEGTELDAKTTENKVGGDGLAGLSRHGSLPSKHSAYSIGNRTGLKKQPSVGATRLDAILATSPTSLHSSVDDDGWKRVVAQRKHTENIDTHSSSALSNSVLRHQRSLQLISSGNRPYFDFRLPPSSAHPSGPGGGHSRTPSGAEDPSEATEVEGSVRRHQSLNVQGMNSRISDRLKSTPLPPLNTQSIYSSSKSHGRSTSHDERLYIGSNRLAPNEDLPPPTSPIQASLWRSPTIAPTIKTSNLAWDDSSRGMSAVSPISPVPGSARFGSVIKRMEEEANGASAMNDEQLQNAFEAASLGRLIAGSNPLNPSMADVGRLSPDPSGLQKGRSSRNHSRSSSRNQERPVLASNPPPRFAASSPQPSNPSPPSESGGLAPTFVDHPPFRPSPSPSSSTPSMTGTKKLSLLTDPVSLGQVPGQKKLSGPVTAAPYVPPIGHTTQPPSSALPGKSYHQGSQWGGRPNVEYTKPFTAVGTGWDQKHAILGSRPYSSSERDNGSIPIMQQPLGGGAVLHPTLLQAQAQALATGNMAGGYPIPFLPQLTSPLATTAGYLPMGNGAGLAPTGALPIGDGMFLRSQGAIPTLPALGGPLDIQGLIQAKGYNPQVFDTNPPMAKFFVIKSYTEDDVAKSLKFEIWASTRYGNARLDKCFKEYASRMPIYLLFSVNSSGHFAGVAQMLTDVDYNTTSTVWAQDKWKGIFRVKWIYVKDVPNQALRHIRLTNTSENKPVTNSRDTQELPFEAGLEMLQIFHHYQARTSLLQDYSYYEMASSQRDLQQQVESSIQPVPHLPPFPALPTAYTRSSAGQVAGGRSSGYASPRY